MFNVMNLTDLSQVTKLNFVYIFILWGSTLVPLSDLTLR